MLPSGPKLTSVMRRRSVLGVERKWPTRGQIDANDPLQKC